VDLYVAAALLEAMGGRVAGDAAAVDSDHTPRFHGDGKSPFVR
jgi:hypothetical protein